MPGLIHWMHDTLSSFRPGERNASLHRSQFESLSKQIPILHVSLITNTLIVSYIHAPLAPRYLWLYVPGVICLFCLARLILWRREQGNTLDDATIARRLRATVALAGGLGIVFTSWALNLYPYGGPYEQGQLAFYMSITVLGCYLSLTHVPASTFLLFITVILPFSIFFAASGRPTYVAMALNMMIVAGAMGLVTIRYYRDFVDLVRAKESLTERQRETQRLSDENFRLANLDSLTGAPNRRRFFAELDARLAEARDQGRRLAIGLIDLDGFKPVNDIYGHARGDELLVMVAERLTTVCGARAMLARLGGDEFGLLMSDPEDERDVRGLGAAIIRALQEPFEMPLTRVRISGSAGFAMFPAAGKTGAALFERADHALYHAKETRRGSVVIFSAEHESRIRQTAQVAQNLRTADLENELRVAFQPIMDARTGRTTGFEALARWTSAKLGEIDPEVFIRLAERHNMVNELTRVLLGKTLRSAALWPDHLRVSFNLSTHDLASPDAMTRIVDILRRSPFPVDRIDFEITETAVFVDFEQARLSIEALKTLGARVSLDDFGRGYSSLAYVQQLPLDRIKIDQSFVADIETNAASRNIVKTIVDLCRNLGLSCVAEGVETRGQLRALRELDCHTVQGYLFARPMAGERIPAYLLREATRPAEPATATEREIA